MENISNLALLFDNISQQTLLMLEALFVSKISPEEYIAQQTSQNQHKFKIDPFVLERSSAFTRKSLAESGARLTKQVNYHNNRSLSAPSEHLISTKKKHYLNYSDFAKAMQLCFHASLVQTNYIFLQLCKGAPLKNSRSYELMQAGELVDLKSADMVFGGCEIYYMDLLNFITTQTKVIYQQINVQMEQLQVPRNFSHRLKIETSLFLEGLNTFFTCSRDGLAQFWTSSHTSHLLNFTEEEANTFGISDEKMSKLVKEWTANQETKGLQRIKNIEVLSQVISGEIDIGRTAGPSITQQIDLNTPFALIYTLTNPISAGEFEPLKTDENYTHELVLACRAADAPLPSGRPIPDRVWRNRRSQVIIAPETKWKREEEYSGGGYTLYNNCKGIPRSESCKCRSVRDHSSKMQLDEFLNAANRELPRAKSTFGAYEHPIFAGEQGGPLSSLAKYEQVVLEEEDAELAIEKHRKANFREKDCANTCAWINSLCYYPKTRSLIAAVSGGEMFMFSIERNSIELSKKIKIQGVAVKEMCVWTRVFTRIQISKLAEKQQMNIDNYCATIPGLFTDETPCNGEPGRNIDYCVYICRDTLGFINLDKQVLALELKLFEIDPSLEDDFISEMCIFNKKLLLGLSSGTVIELNPVDLSVSYKFEPFNTEISSFSKIENNSMLIMGTITGNIKIFDYATVPKQTQELHDSGSILQLFASEKYDAIISVCVNGTITIFSIQSYNEVAKTFANEELSVAMWDEESGHLVVGEVELFAYKIIGTLKQEDKVHTIPQIHYCKVIGVISLQDTEDEYNNISSENEIIENDRVSTNGSPVVAEGTCLPDAEPLVSQQQSFVYRQFIRKDLAHRPKFLDDMKPCQPEYKQDNTTTPFSVYKTGEQYLQYPEEEDTQSEPEQLRMNLYTAVSNCKYEMMNFEALYDKLGVENKTFRRQLSGKSETTGIEIMQICQGINKSKIQHTAKTILSGFLTIDEEANIREFSNSGKIQVTYEIDLKDNEKVLSGSYNAASNDLYINLSDGQCITYNIITSQLNETYNSANCAKAAYLLEFRGQQISNGVETEEFRRFLKCYTPQIYERPTLSQVYQNSIAIAAGQFVLIFSKNSHILSQKFVESLLLSHARQYREIIDGMTAPPSLILKGHLLPIIAISAAGRKMLTADEGGTVCCWYGIGIAKYVFHIREDYIQTVQASYRPELWGWIMLKNGDLLQIAFNNEVALLVRFNISGVGNYQFQAYERGSTTLMAFSDGNKGVVVSVAEKIRIVAQFVLPCGNCVISALLLQSNQVIVSCSNGHVYIGQLVESTYSGDLQPLYELKGNQLRYNQMFEKDLDEKALTPLAPLMISILQEKESEEVVSEATEELFEQFEQTQENIEENMILDEDYDIRELSKLTNSEYLKMSTSIINSESIELARQEAMMGIKFNFK